MNSLLGEFLANLKEMEFRDLNSNETLEKLTKIEKEVDEKVDDLLKEEPRRLGFCHLFWETKKRLLKEEYGIDWFTPAESNTDIIFD